MLAGRSVNPQVFNVTTLKSIKAKFDIWRRDMRWKMQLLYVSLPVHISKQYPDFLCIGAPKSATTWLHKRLGMHPDIFLPKCKELHFFDTPYVNTNLAGSTSLGSDDKGKLGYYKPYDMASRRHWRWYLFQFQGGRQLVKGDITPTYARASEENIASIAMKIPNIKIIYILRNPIERAWSGASYFMYRWHGKGMSEQMEEGVVKNWVLEPERLDHGFYMEKITAWEKYIKKENILYLFYDDIKNSPRSVLNEICEFIGVDKNKLPDSSGDSRTVNSGYPKYKISHDVWSELYGIYKDEIRCIEERFGRDLSAWNDEPQ